MSVDHLKILVIEDNDPDFRLISEYAKECITYPFALKRVKSLADAIKAMGEEEFDAVLSDLNLPDSMGLNTLTSIVKASPHLPVVVITGFDDEKLGIEALQKGAQDYLVKGKMQCDILSRSIKYSIERKKKESLGIQLETEKVKRLSDIGTLAATVAHELRNPLAAIGMAIQNIKRKAKSSDLDKHIANIEKKVGESDQIISNILSYSHIKPPHYESVDIFEVVLECIDHLEGNCKKTISVIRNIEPLKNVHMEVDPVQIKEVLNNILNNACDALQENEGKIEIAGLQEDGFIRISIVDNGHGIDKEHLVKVFDPFFTTKAKGTGLGLSVCRQIVNMHGGEIGIRSELGQGTSVVVRLPRKGI